MNCVTKGQFYKVILEFLLEIPWEFIFEATSYYVQIRIITRYVIKGQNCIVVSKIVENCCKQTLASLP